MLDDDLRALMSVEPSADFEARVRRGVAQDRMSAGVPRWTGGMAFAAGLAIVVGLGTWIAGRPSSEPRAAWSAVAPTIGEATVAPDPSEPAEDIAPSTHYRRPHERNGAPRRGTAGAPVAVVAQFDMDEARALQALLASPNMLARGDTPHGYADSTSSELVVRELNVAPLVVTELVEATPLINTGVDDATSERNETPRIEEGARK